MCSVLDDHIDGMPPVERSTNWNRMIPFAVVPKGRDLPPAGPSLMTRVCGFGLDSRRFRAGQARRARSPQIAQASGALRPVFCSRAMSVA